MTRFAPAAILYGRMISFVIPVQDEEPTLQTLCAEIIDVAGQAALEIEIIFVDDGSTDGSWARIVDLAASDGRIRGLRLRRNFGKAAALSAGFAEVKGDIVFTLDADLQDDPHEIPRFLAKLNEGYDMVSGWKRVRHDPWHKVWPSRVFNRIVGALTGLHLHDHVCGFKCFRAEVLREVHLYGEMHRFFAVRAFARGFRITEIEVHHRPREHGRSKYGVSRFGKGFLDLLTVWFTIRYGRRPMHVLGTIGGGIVLLGVLCLLVGGWWAALILVLFGAQWLGLGWLAESRLAAAPPGITQYSLAGRAGAGATEVHRDDRAADDPPGS
ncbi:MAG TPA: glycosyltransferase family 2 protein [Phycisphaerae bacterium]|nr:glycosyltransferase family 2 protein [Phycisphaerae bacterium]